MIILVGQSVSLHSIARTTMPVSSARSRVRSFSPTTATKTPRTRAYAALKENNDKATRDSALKSAQTTIDRAAEETEAFRHAHRLDGQDDALKQQLLGASDQLASQLKAAFVALQNDDTAAYVTINDRDIRNAGIAYSAAVEKFQKQNAALVEESAAAASALEQQAQATASAVAAFRLAAA